MKAEAMICIVKIRFIRTLSLEADILAKLARRQNQESQLMNVIERINLRFKFLHISD